MIQITFSNDEVYHIKRDTVDRLFWCRYRVHPFNLTLSDMVKCIGWVLIAFYAKPQGNVESNYDRVTNLDNARIEEL